MDKIVIISNNIALKGFKEEHGLSLMVEKDGSKSLIDFGNGDAFLYNLKKLNIDPLDINQIILSHGHYDHTGNIKYILERNKDLSIIMHPGALNTRFSIHKTRDPSVRNIGISRENLKSLENRTILSKKQSLHCGINITGQIPRLSSEDSGGPFFFDKEGCTVDLIEDDQAIWFNTQAGLFIITGCCHSGIINTVEHIKKISGNNNISSILGGLHLLHASKERINYTVDYLNSLNLDCIYPGHCTGEEVITSFKETLNCPVKMLYAGEHICI